MMIALLAILFAIAGALVYALSGNAKLAELGRLTFLAAMIALMLEFAKHVVKIG